MRLQLRRPGRSGACAALAAAILVAAWPATPLRAENRVTVRGAYFLEASTRVIQPTVEISKDLPDGFDITAAYLLDAITSASVAAGTASDTIFTELRNQAALVVGKTRNRLHSSLGYTY